MVGLLSLCEKPREFDDQIITASPAQRQAAADPISQNDPGSSCWADWASLVSVGVDQLSIVVRFNGCFWWWVNFMNSALWLILASFLACSAPKLRKNASGRRVFIYPLPIVARPMCILRI